jgi:GNAT superfamily N-acetyltransferase
MTTSTSIHDLDAHWSGLLGRDLADIPAGRCVVTPHPQALASYRGIYAWSRGDACVVSAPPEFVRQTAEVAGGKSPADVIDSDALPSALREELESIVGPAVVSYADHSDFVPVDEMGARPLTPSDIPALRQLSRDAGAEAWENSGISFDRVPILGIYDQHILVAAASYERWGERILHVGVVTHPEHRGKGFGRGVASATTAHALEAGGIAQWQTLETNTPSLAIAKKLGYQPYCRTLAIRLRGTQPAS